MNNYNYDEIDLTLAIQLQAQFEEELRVQRIKEEEKQKSLDLVGHKWNAKWMSLPEPEQSKLSVSLTDPCWECLDPTPNIHDLFITFNHQFFWGRLMGVEVKWSPRMTLCAGVCSYEGRGGLCSVRLSTPLLKLRPRKDLIETLLHEMIHAYLFVTHNNTDHDGHGPQFHKHMYRINNLSGTNITVFHSFHNEVNVYRQHVWQCDGPCRTRPPYYGLVKRSMNRPPMPRDPWWGSHAQSCGGSYTKIQEPEGYGVKKSKRKVKETTNDNDIRSYFPASGSKRPKSLLEGKENDGSSSSKGGSNVAGFSSSSTFGDINRVDVTNASNSNVHGFGSENNVKKSKGFGEPGISKGSTTSGTKSGNKGSKGLVGTAVGTSFGSKTVVVNKKTPRPPEDTSEESVRKESKVNAFVGTGYVLGKPDTAQPGRSRLIAQYDKNVRKCDDNNPLASSSREMNDATMDSTSRCTNPPNENQTVCPLCLIPIDNNAFEEHIGICLGDFDADSDIEWDSNNDHPKSVTKNTENATSTTDMSHSNNSNNDYSFKDSSLKGSNSSSDSNKPVKKIHDSSDECIMLSDDEGLVSATLFKMIPCPVCNENFNQDIINTHVNSHFT